MQTNIAHVLAQMVEAWDDGDAENYASYFTTDATYVTFLGSVSKGRSAIASDHEPVLTRFQKAVACECKSRASVSSATMLRSS